MIITVLHENVAQHVLNCYNKKREMTQPLLSPTAVCYSHPGIDVKLMSIHHCLCLRLKLPVVADIKINGVLQPFTANQLKTWKEKKYLNF